MTENKVLADTILSASTETATIRAPLEAIDIADWLRNLPDKEYQRRKADPARAARDHGGIPSQNRHVERPYL